MRHLCMYFFSQRKEEWIRGHRYMNCAHHLLTTKIYWRTMTRTRTRRPLNCGGTTTFPHTGSLPKPDGRKQQRSVDLALPLFVYPSHSQSDFLSRNFSRAGDVGGAQSEMYPELEDIKKR